MLLTFSGLLLQTLKKRSATKQIIAEGADGLKWEAIQALASKDLAVQAFPLLKWIYHHFIKNLPITIRGHRCQAIALLPLVDNMPKIKRKTT